MKKISLILSLCLFMTLAQAQKTTQIKGQVLNNLGYKTVYLENILSETITDSANIDNKGNFVFNTPFVRSDFYKLIFDYEAFVMYIPNPGEKAKIIYDTKNPENPTIKGSPQTALVYETLQKSNNFDKQIADYTEQIEKERKEMVREMISKNPESLACLFFINGLDPSEDADIYKKLSEGLNKYSDNYLVQDLQSKVAAQSFLEIGSEAPEISLPTPNGKIVKLSDLRGNYVLIDFWAGWCRPCRAESPNMVRFYNKYHSKGFEIYSVSLDKEKASWEKAIKDDGLGAWTHVSDLKFWQSEAAAAYQVQAIPFTVLIDKEGKIIAKNLRGETLENKLEEIFSKQ